MTEDKPEIEVVMAGQTCLNVIQDELRKLSDSKLKSKVVVPDTLRLVVEGLQCNSNLDLRTTTAADDHPDSEIKYGAAFGEVAAHICPVGCNG